jgi:heptosyltransferase-2
VQKALKILIVRFSSIGDIAQALSIIPKLKASSKNYEIHWITKTEFGDLIELQSDIDCVWRFDASKGILELIKLGFKLRKERFDVFYDAHFNIRSLLLKFILAFSIKKNVTRIKYRIKRFLLFNFRIDRYPLPFRGILSFIKPLFKSNVITDDSYVKTELSFSSEVKEEINDLLRFDNFIALAPSAAHKMKRWPQEYWKNLITIMPTSNFVILGGPKDTFCKNFEEIFPERVQNLAGKISLTNSAYVIVKSKLIVSADSGMIHVADLINKSGIILLGPTAFGYPSGKSIKVIETPMPCRPCSKDGRGNCKLEVYQKCLIDISPGQVVAKINSILVK